MTNKDAGGRKAPHKYPKMRKPTGPRPTAGREPIYKEAMQRITGTVPEPYLAYIKQLGGGNASKGIRLLVEYHQQSTGHKAGGGSDAT